MDTLNLNCHAADNLRLLSCSNTNKIQLPGILSSHPARIAIILFAAAHVIFANKVIKHNQDLRIAINHKKLFGIQLMLHPVLIGGAVCLANRTGNEWWGFVIVPFVFNFGAEPMDLSKMPRSVLTTFQVLMYVHHAGPLLACLDCFGIPGGPAFAFANGLLYAHAWSLHTLVSLDYRKALDKQKFFWPYMLQAFLIMTCWWSAMRQSLEEITVASVAPLLVGPMFQYGGRWGLYEYIRCVLLGYPKPGDGRYDAFETRKQLGELSAFVLAAIVVFVRF